MIEADPTVIAITGMKRCGTTFQFNVCRLACEMAGYDVWAGGPAIPDAFDAIEEGEADVYVVKEHRWRSDLAVASNYVFTAIRPLDEVKCSMESFRGKPSEGDIEEWRGWLRKWAEYETWRQPYDLLVTEPRICVETHVEALKLGVEVDALCEKVAAEIQPPTEARQDEGSLVFEDHYQSNDPEQIAERLMS